MKASFTAVLLIFLSAHRPALGGEHSHASVAAVPRRLNVLERWQPRGGFDPDGGGLLHWWNPHCFTRCGEPDDYCPKPPPRICLPVETAAHGRRRH